MFAAGQKKFRAAVNQLSSGRLFVASATNDRILNISTTFDPYESIVFLTNRLGRLLAIRIKQEIAEEENWIIGTHIGILVDLWEKDGVRQQDLALSNIKDKATIARSLHTLEEHAMVERIPDEMDRRNKLIFLTEKGRDMRNRLMPYALSVSERAQTNISEEEMRICKQVLRQMYENLH